MLQIKQEHHQSSQVNFRNKRKLQVVNKPNKIPKLNDRIDSALLDELQDIHSKGVCEQFDDFLSKNPNIFLIKICTPSNIMRPRNVDIKPNEFCLLHFALLKASKEMVAHVIEQMSRKLISNKENAAELLKNLNGYKCLKTSLSSFKETAPEICKLYIEDGFKFEAALSLLKEAIIAGNFKIAEYFLLQLKKNNVTLASNERVKLFEIIIDGRKYIFYRNSKIKTFYDFDKKYISTWPKL